MTDHPTPENSIFIAAQALCAVLDEENAALQRFDVPRATALVPAKRSATDALLLAQRQGALSPSPESLALAERLQHAALQNKKLLERAIEAQKRVMGCIARAVPRAISQGGRYGAKGAVPKPAMTPAVALSARA